MATQTVATLNLDSLTVDRLIHNNFNRMDAFKRSIKVFLKSYIHYNDFSVNLYEQCLAEYMQKMAHLYDVIDQVQQLPPNWMQHLLNQVNNEQVNIYFFGIKYQGDFVKSAKLTFNLGIINNQPVQATLDIDPDNLDEFKAGISISIPQRQFRKLNTNDQQIVITYEDTFWTNDRNDFPVFEIPYRRIHPEGYQQSLNFGEDIQIVFCIRIEAVEHNPNPMEVQSFHFHSLYYMFEKRIQEFRTKANFSAHIHRSTVKKRITYTQTQIDPTIKEEAFWKAAPNPPDPTQHVVKFMDMQIGVNIWEQIEGQFCTCNEFCNLNAFFHYNPIYRFLMVRHNQLYIKNKSNIPNIYLFVISALMRSPVPPAVSPTPLARLLNSANYQRQEYRYRELSDLYFSNLCDQCLPNASTLLGVTYNLLRYSVEMADNCIETDKIPFSDQSLENISNYNKVLLELHEIISDIPLFVDPNDSKSWFTEYESINRRHFHRYIVWSFREILSAPDPGLDYLFTENYEYSTKVLKSEAEEQLMKSRFNILIPYHQAFSNPMNIRFECQGFTYGVIKIWEYITKFEPNLSAVYLYTSVKKLYDFCVDMDDLFKDTTFAQNFNQNLVNCRDFPQDLVAIKDQMFVYYKLKTYFHAFAVQKYFSESYIKFCKRVEYTGRYAFTEFEHIWDNEWIENIYPGHILQLFSSPGDQIKLRFNRFYDIFWKKARYETNIHATFTDIMVQVVLKYGQVNFWQQNNGDNRLKFRAIFSEFEQSLNLVVTESQAIYWNHLINIYSSIEYLYRRNDHFIDVIDEIIYWLVKAICFMILRLVSIFLRNIDDQEVYELSNHNKMYLLCKPGFLQLFLTFKTVFEVLRQIKTDYIVFDDIFDRISKTVSQTKAIVKQFYKNFYNRIIHKWFEEIEDMFDNNHPYSQPTMKFHLISGLSLLGALIDDFRKPSAKIRKKLKSLRSRNSNTNTTQIQFNETWDQCLIWLTLRDQIKMSAYFVSQHWTNHCQTDLTQFTQHNQRLSLWIARADQL